MIKKNTFWGIGFLVLVTAAGDTYAATPCDELWQLDQWKERDTYPTEEIGDHQLQDQMDINLGHAKECLAYLQKLSPPPAPDPFDPNSNYGWLVPIIAH